MNTEEAAGSNDSNWVSKELGMEENDEEGEAPEEWSLLGVISEKIALIPPLLPLKFGNGLLLQYTVNQPGLDDRLGLLEVGLAIGLSSFALLLVSASSSYLFKSAPKVLLVSEEKRKTAARVLNLFNRVVCSIQICLLVLLFSITLSHYKEADFIDSDSEYYVKKRIFMFSLIVSSVMFGSLILIFLITGSIFFRQSPVKSPPPYQMDNSSHLPPPARSLLPLGLANALLDLYIYIGTITILLTVLESVCRLVLMASLRDGVV